MPTSPNVPLRMAPTFSARPWGGTRLRNVLHKSVPDAGVYGEAWELSDHPDGPSRIAGGPFDGKLFGDVVRAHPQAMLGLDQAPARFPLLVKYIDAAQDLSVQVHPDDAYAAMYTHGDRGKTECWYIMDCAPSAEVVAGIKPGVTRDVLAAAIRTGKVHDTLHRQPIRPGMFVFMPARTVHAVLANTLLCEVQQSSNTTYRFYDWDREPRRELHIEHSLHVIDYEHPNSALSLDVPLSPAGEVQTLELTSNVYFAVQAVVLAGNETYTLRHEGCAIVNIVRGSGNIGDQPAQLGDTYFIPAASPEVALTAGAAGMTVLVSVSNEL